MKTGSRSARVIFSLLLLVGFLAGLSAPTFVAAEEKEVKHASPLQAGKLEVVINEVAWAGTEASTTDEWIELYNPDTMPIPLDGWTLTDGGDYTINFSATDIIPGGPTGGFFLIEATNDMTISDITADFVYTGVGDLNNSDETLTLLDDFSNVIDTANSDGDEWPAGGLAEHYSMERTCVIEDQQLGWQNNDGVTRNGLDSDSNPINGTPGEPNSSENQCLVISEVAWSGSKASGLDEWLELHNPSPATIDLAGWRLTAGDGSPDIALSGTISANGFFLLERGDSLTTDQNEDQIYNDTQLVESGEALLLLAPNRTEIDSANVDGGSWTAGTGSPNYSSMERIKESGIVSPDDQFGWITNTGIVRNGEDAAGNDIYGTPGQSNWAFIVTPTPTATVTLTPTTTAPLSLLINEVAWMGTDYSSSDEWIEIYNPGTNAINLTGWKLKSITDSNPDISLTGTIAAGGYYVIASNADVFDDGVHTPLVPNLIYSLSLNNEGEVLRLLDPRSTVVDTANSDGGAWPAGVGSPTYATMERRSVSTDGFFAWSTYANPANSSTPNPPPYPDPVIYDQGGERVKGTPGQANWGLTVTQTPTRTATPPRTATRTRTPVPTRTPTKRPTATPYLSRLVLINEFLARPGSDWNHDGLVNVYDEFIEVINADSVEINLKGWQLDDEANAGSAVYTLPEKVLKPGQRAVFYGLETNILLSDGGDSIRLIRSSGDVADVQEYKFARYPDVSECQYPEGPGYFGVWQAACFPTPGTANQLTGELPSQPEGKSALEPVCLLPDTLLEDFLLAECSGYGAELWNAWYWDKDGWGNEKNVPDKNNQWQTRIE